MLIDNITYKQTQDELTCSISACLYMLLHYYGENIDIEYISELFSNVFMSIDFTIWYNESLDNFKYKDNRGLYCACFLLNKYYPKLKSSIISTEIANIKLSYIKRRIPVILTGRLPIFTGVISTSILVKGSVDNYLIVNDPRGNANSEYRDKHGENMLYSISNLQLWTSHYIDKVYILRVSP